MVKITAIKARVQKIIEIGRHGVPFCVTMPLEKAEIVNGSVTFALRRPIWGEEDWPEPGISLVLGDLREKRDGWRAYKARYFRPEDKTQG